MTTVDQPVSVLVCRGCCCGTESKLPDVDHDAHLERMRAAVHDNVESKLRTVDCLGPCGDANVVVVRRGSDRWWFGNLHTDTQIDALSQWLAAPGSPPPVDLQIDAPRSMNLRRLAPERGDDLVDWLVAAFDSGSWLIGVHGATGEFEADHPTIRRNGSIITATTPTGALRIEVDDRTRLFTFGRADAPEQPWANLLARTGPTPEPNMVVTEVGRDAEAVDPAHGDDVLFDLGIGRSLASFMIRTGDAELQQLLARSIGRAWTDMSASLRAEIASASPHRVVSTGLGRVEAYSSSPTPDDETPFGSHGYLNPDHLELGIDWPLGLDVPKGWTSGVVDFISNDAATT